MASPQSILLLTVGVLACISIAQASRAHHGFFQDLGEEQKNQVSEILHSGKPKAEIRTQIRQWVSSQSKQIQDAFQDAEKAHEARRQRIHAKRQQLLSTVSVEAKELDGKIRAIYKDQNLTKKETCEKVQALVKEASEQIKKELKLKELNCNH